MTIEKAIYTARANAMGGRVGTVKSDDGQINLKLDRPLEMGGKGNGTNPEPLFAAGYSAWYIGALRVVEEKRYIRIPEALQRRSGRIRHRRGYDDPSTRH
jgi:osmotically inducible protein OsmC